MAAPQARRVRHDYAAAQGIVAAGLGVTLLPSLVLDIVRHPDVAVRPVRGRSTRTISAVALQAAATVPSVRALLDALARDRAPGTTAPTKKGAGAPNVLSVPVDSLSIRSH